MNRCSKVLRLERCPKLEIFENQSKFSPLIFLSRKTILNFVCTSYNTLLLKL